MSGLALGLAAGVALAGAPDLTETTTPSSEKIQIIEGTTEACRDLMSEATPEGIPVTRNNLNTETCGVFWDRGDTAVRVSNLTPEAINHLSPDVKEGLASGDLGLFTTGLIASPMAFKKGDSEYSSNASAPSFEVRTEETDGAASRLRIVGARLNREGDQWRASHTLECHRDDFKLSERRAPNDPEGNTSRMIVDRESGGFYSLLVEEPLSHQPWALPQDAGKGDPAQLAEWVLVPSQSGQLQDYCTTLIPLRDFGLELLKKQGIE